MNEAAGACVLRRRPPMKATRGPVKSRAHGPLEGVRQVGGLRRGRVPEPELTFEDLSRRDRLTEGAGIGAHERAPIERKGAVAGTVRAARRLANSLHAEFLAVSVSSPKQGGLDERAHEALNDAMRLAEELGARSATLTGDDIVAELIAYARQENVTTLVMGKPVRPRWKEMLFGFKTLALRMGPDITASSSNMLFR